MSRWCWGSPPPRVSRSHNDGYCPIAAMFDAQRECPRPPATAIPGDGKQITGLRSGAAADRGKFDRLSPVSLGEAYTRSERDRSTIYLAMPPDAYFPGSLSKTLRHHTELLGCVTRSDCQLSHTCGRHFFRNDPSPHRRSYAG